MADGIRRSTLVAVLLAATWAVAGGNGGGDAILGLWRTEPGKDGAAIVRIVRDGETYRGTIVWLEKPVYGPDEERPGQPKVDLNNPDPDLRERPVLGLEILTGFRYDGRGKWKKGTIYDPSNGKTYRCKMWLDGPDTLKVRGFIGFSLLGRNATWRRVDKIPDPSPDQPGGAEEEPPARP